MKTPVYAYARKDSNTYYGYSLVFSEKEKASIQAQMAEEKTTNQYVWFEMKEISNG